MNFLVYSIPINDISHFIAKSVIWAKNMIFMNVFSPETKTPEALAVAFSVSHFVCNQFIKSIYSHLCPTTWIPPPFLIISIVYDTGCS